MNRFKKFSLLKEVPLETRSTVACSKCELDDKVNEMTNLHNVVIGTRGSDGFYAKHLPTGIIGTGWTTHGASTSLKEKLKAYLIGRGYGK